MWCAGTVREEAFPYNAVDACAFLPFMSVFHKWVICDSRKGVIMGKMKLGTDQARVRIEDQGDGGCVLL